MNINVENIITKGGNVYKEIELVNNGGMKVKCINLGAIITEIYTSDKNEVFENVVLGYKDYDTYLSNPAYLGAAIGRNSGRIGGGKIKIGGIEYLLNKNDGNNTLHGGVEGYNFKCFEFDTFEEVDSIGVKFQYISRDGEGGFPGEVKVSVTYTLNNDNELKLSYSGESDKDTILNMTNHTYFNLSGNCKRKITEQNLYINSNKFTELDDESIVTGKMLEVINTPFDFRNPKKIGRDIEADHEQLKLTKGYDHYFELNNGNEISAELHDDVSGRFVQVRTNYDGVVVYSGNYISEGLLSIERNIDYRDAICLETQNLPVGRDNLFIQSSLLTVGDKYSKETVYKFGVK